MTNKTEATREEAITAAAMLFAEVTPLSADWERAGWDSEYTRGILEVLADTFGADVEDHYQAKAAIWAEIRTKHEETRRPWLKAKPGEIWELEIEGQAKPRWAIVHFMGYFYYSKASIDRDSPRIISARKVYDPEEGAY